MSRFALPPLITMLAQSFGFMIAGSAMVESVFSIPGLGSMLVTALGARDTITINACAAHRRHFRPGQFYRGLRERF
ncbi:MAG: ABC transporter permease subunit [Hydrogeniiclostridium mannosilyticum]